MIEQLEEAITGYCELVQSSTYGNYVLCDKQSKLLVTLFHRDGVITIPSMAGKGEKREIELLKLMRLGAFNFALISDDENNLFIQLIPHTNYTTIISYHHVYDFGLDLDVRTLLGVKSNHLIFTPYTYKEVVG